MSLSLFISKCFSVRCRVSLQRKKCCQQIIGFDDESFSIAMCIDAKEESMLGEMLGDAV